MKKNKFLVSVVLFTVVVLMPMNSYAIGGLGWLGRVATWVVKIFDQDNEVCLFKLQGDAVSCAGQEKTYKINRAKFDEINWSVSDGGAITSISGLDIDDFLIDYKQKNGLPLNFPVVLRHFYANNDKLQFSYEATLTSDVTTIANVGAAVILSYNGQTVTVDTAGLKASVDVSNNTNLKQKLEFAFKDVFKGDKGAEIEISFDGTRPSVEVKYYIIDSGVLDFCNDGGNKKVVTILPRPQKPVISGLPNRVVNCNEQFGLSTTSQGNNISLLWTIDDAVTYGQQIQAIDVDTYAGTYVQIGGFKRVGPKSVYLAAANSCGDVEYTTATINVQEQASRMILNNNVNLVATRDVAPIISPSCNEAKYNGISMNVNPYINGAIYTWYIPVQWRVMSNENYIDNSLSNPSFLVYKGTNLNYMQIRSRVDTEIPNGEVRLRIQTPCGGDETIKYNISGSPALNLNLDDNFSCNSTFQIKPTITGGTAPFTINWKNNNATGNVTPLVTYNPSIAITYTQSTNNFNTAKVQATVTDARGCTSTDEAAYNVFGGFGNPTISGWASGRLDFEKYLKVTSNLVSSQNGSKIYFTALDENDKPKVYVYQFDNSINVKKWVAKEIVASSPPRGSNNTLALAQETSNTLLLYTSSVGGVRGLRLNASDVSDPTKEAKFDAINAETFQIAQNKGADGNFVASSLTLIFKENNSGYLKYQQLSLQNGELQLSGVPQVIVNKAIHYDFDQFNFKVFYFLDDFSGDLYCKDLKKPTEAPQSVKLASNDLTTSIYNETEIEFDKDGNMFVFQNGDLYILRYSSLTETYNKLEKLSVSQMTGLNLMGTTGSFTLNPSTSTIYYTGYDNNIYQIFKENLTGSTWKIVKSTRPGVNGYSDQAGSKLLYRASHLFYVSTDNRLIYNLFYVQGNNTDCVPSNLRVSENTTYTEGIDLSNVPSISTEVVLELDFSKSNMYAFPNPISDLVTVFAEGEGEAILELYNTLGEKVLSVPFDFNGTTLNVQNLVKGVYIARLIQNNTSINQIKLVK